MAAAAYNYISPTKMLATDASSVIKINSLPQFTMIRTGVQGKGSCYLHALITDINGKEFRSLSLELRDQLIHQTRKALAENLTVNDYLQLLNGELAKLQVFEILETKWVELFFNIYPDEVQRKYGDNIFKLKAEISEQIQKLDNIEQELQQLDPLIAKPTKNILQTALRKAHQKFQSSLSRSYTDIDQYSMKYIDSKLNVNVVFIKPDGNIYTTSRSDCEQMKQNKLPFVLVYYLDEYHFEAIGRLNANGTLQSYFPNDDPMIAQLLRSC